MVSKEEQKEIDLRDGITQIHKKMTGQGHVPPDVDDLYRKGSMYIYQRCSKCRVSLYLWATMGMPPCEASEITDDE